MSAKPKSRRHVSKAPSWAFRVMHLWERKNAEGVTFLSGSAGGLRVLIYKNQVKQGDDDPDYLLCFAPRQPAGMTDDPAAGPTPELKVECDL